MTTGKIIELFDTHKAKAAFLAPLLTALGAAVASWIVTGQWSASEIRTAAGGAVLGLVSALATYLTPAGSAMVDPRVPPGDRRPGVIPSERGLTLLETVVVLLAVVVVLLLLFVVR